MLLFFNIMIECIDDGSDDDDDGCVFFLYFWLCNRRMLNCIGLLLFESESSEED